MNVAHLDKVDTDAPLFAPDAFQPYRFPGRPDCEMPALRQARCWRRAPLSMIATPPSRSRISATCIRKDCSQSAFRNRRAASAPITRPTPLRLRTRPLLRRNRAVLEHACLLDAVVGTDFRRDGHARRTSRALHLQAPRSALQAHPRQAARSMHSRSPKAARRPRAPSPSAPKRGRSTVAISSTARRSLPRSPAPPIITARSARAGPKAKKRCAATRSISAFPPTRRASASPATGIRSACAAPSRAR